MLKATWMRLGSPAWLAVGLVVLLPTLAQAQLFPNRTIRRERPPCASEPPFNAQVRRDYFGYYPTCWTRFPAGWACPCPNPELPDPAKSFRDNPLKQPRPAGEGDRQPGMDEENPDGMVDPKPANPAGDNSNIPLPNGGRSPFDLDASPKPVTPPANTDPFTAPKPAAPAGRPSASTGLIEMPNLPETSPSTTYEPPARSGSMRMSPEATLASSDTSDVRPDLGPLPASPLPTSNPPTASTTPSGFPTGGSPTPAQAPRRRSFLGGLFGGNNRNR